jgi:Tfp pilus assembly protein PilF
MGKASRKKNVSGSKAPGKTVQHEKKLKPSREFPSSDGPQETTSTVTYFQILVLLLISFAVYFNALSGDFVYDDNMQIVDNPWIRNIRNIPNIFSRSVWSFQPGVTTSNYYRPLMHVVYMLNYHVFGLKAWGFHLINILFHCGASVLVFLILRKLLTGYKAIKSSTYLSAPFIAAALFASHPIHTEAVTWIAGLPDVAFTFFYLLSLYFYIRAEAVRSLKYLFSVACFAVAAFFKEPALTLPVVLFAYDYLFRRERIRFSDYLTRYVTYFLIVVGYLALRIHALGGFAPVKGHAALSVYQYAINVFPLFIRYMGKLFVPLNLNVAYVLQPIDSLLQLKAVLCLMGTVAFVVLFPIFFKKNKIVFFGLVLVAVPLLPVLYIPNLGPSIFAERYLYLPSVGYALLVSTFLLWAKQKMPRSTGGITLLFLVLWGLFSVGTIMRNTVWHDSLTLWTDTVKKSPDSEIAHNYLGVLFKSQGQPDKAMTEFQTALRLNPDFAEAHYDLGNLYKSQGQPDKAIAEFQAALRLKPDYAEAHNNLGIVYNSQGQPDKAMVEFQTAVRLIPDYADAHNNLGIVYASQGQLDKALAEFQTALRLNPDLAQTHNNLGIIYESQGRLDKAIAEFQTALRLKPDFYDARRRLNDIISRRPK